MEEFPKYYGGLETESLWQKRWEEEGIYRFDPDSSKPVYSIDTPPPTVSGQIHIGHVFSYTQAEIMIRYFRMNGFNIFYPFGFDDNGLPTERFVEKQLGVSAASSPGRSSSPSVWKFPRTLRPNSRSSGRASASPWIGISSTPPSRTTGCRPTPTRANTRLPK